MDSLQASHNYADTGGKRTFRLAAEPPGFFEATEIRNGEAVGLRFILRIEPGKHEPWGEMREKIRERLSSRDIVRDEDGELHILSRRVRAQVHDRIASGEPTPVLFIDDEEFTWEELGAMLTSYAGWGLRIEVCNCGDE